VIVGLFGVCACGNASGNGTTQYTVAAIVVAASGGVPKACAGIPLSLPPADCQGVELEGLDVRAIKGANVYAGGTVQTPVVRLNGTWTGHKLRLTSPPEVVANSAATPVPKCEKQTPSQLSPNVRQIQEAIQQDQKLLVAHGILLLKTEQCDDRLMVVVPVADSSTVSFLQSRYSGIDVYAWFLPA